MLCWVVLGYSHLFSTSPLDRPSHHGGFPQGFLSKFGQQDTTDVSPTGPAHPNSQGEGGWAREICHSKCDPNDTAHLSSSPSEKKAQRKMNEHECPLWWTRIKCRTLSSRVFITQKHSLQTQSVGWCPIFGRSFAMFAIHFPLNDSWASTGCVPLKQWSLCLRVPFLRPFPI